MVGISNVITPKAYRGNGYASKILRETKRLIFEDLRCEFGVLLCAELTAPCTMNSLKGESYGRPMPCYWAENIYIVKKMDLNGFPF